MAFVEGDIPVTFHIPESQLQLRKEFVHHPVPIQIRMMMVRYCSVLFLYAFLCDCTDCIIMPVRLLHVLNKRLKIKNYIIYNIMDSINEKSELVQM